ncbi:hypothetical protein QJS10_CPB22g00483 [Acorus calamus]|uniref:RING-type domain-containing protein n=1 Tax=Acorus calamus TaxID=4465 RepID=A0AAV9BYP5_ACOCL|nr:hypothetical protein QJS10_CPB22g00483 [Acorus calamus]
MSILPSDAQRLDSSSSPAPPQNPRNVDHGLLPHRRRGLAQTLRRVDAGSTRPSDPSIGSSGSTSLVSEYPFESSNVIDSRGPDAKKGLCDQDSGSSLRCQPNGRGGHSVMAPESPFGSSNQSAGRRNQAVNGNHLLNFFYDPISRPQPRPIPRKRQQDIRPYDKDLFLQANYKFVVLDTGCSTIESMDPDKMLQMEEVICVRYLTPFPIQCPICLESPLCPQITSCGHIYCFPCILQFLMMGQEDCKGDCWKRCPLCFMMISCKDLYTMYIDYVKQYHVGDHPEFTLLTRSKDSSVPILKNQQKVALPSSTEDFCGSFAKFTLTSDVEMSVREAKRDLNDWLAKADSGLVDDLEKLPYVCAALEQLDQRMKRWQDHEVMTGSPPVINRASLSSKPRVLKNSSPKTQGHALSSIGVAFEAGSEEHQLPFGTHHVVQRNDSENSGRLSPEKLETDSLSLPDDVRQLFENPEKTTFNEGKGPGKPLHGSKDIQERDSYTFYQAIDGQHLILHPLNMKCLLHYYGSYDLLPPRIGGKILQLETVTQSGSMRKRYRFLSHFSLTTTFQLCEIDLSEILPPDALSPFIEEIRRRENQRKQVAEKELEEKAKADAAAMQETLTQLDFRHSLNNDAAFSIEDFEALGSGTAPSTSPPVVGERKLFSDVTRLGFASAHDSPALKVETSAGSPSKVEERGETSVITGHRNMPMLSFANIVSTAAKALGGPEVPHVEGFGKKGKKSSRILLSTTGGRRY